MDGPVVGIIANPVSARDICRVIANATNLQHVGWVDPGLFPGDDPTLTSTGGG